MHYSVIKKWDIADGPGVRVTLFVSGCTNHCPGCFQPETWDFAFGQPYTKESEEEVLTALGASYVQGLTLLGGEPMEPDNQRALLPFLRRVREAYPGKDIWCYTGFVWERDLMPGGRKYTEATGELLRLLDVLVDGPFLQERRNLMLNFRGSENQRILLMRESLQAGKAVLSPLNETVRGRQA